ncbi:MAG: type II secretion system F family protein, partial [Actinomycetota bacterium]|nr:type II secretion system F family protein [Actinomycetota bacterium]
MADTFQYKVRDRAGNVTTGSLVADSEALVLARLREQGLTALDIKRKKTGIGQIEFGGKKVKLKQVAIFSRQFATMVNSGLPILRALAILADQTDNKELARVLNEARLDVERGSSLSGAIGKHDHVFNNLYVSMVKAGETGGSLDSTLTALAEMIEREVRLRGKIKSAMTYPVAVVALVVLIMSAMLLFVVPQFEAIFSQLGGTLPLPTRGLLFMSEMFQSYWYVVIGGAIGGRFFFRRYKKTEKGREVVDGVKLRAPVFGSLFHKTALSRFSSTLAMLMKSGVPILHALEIVSDTVNNKVIGKAITEVQLSVRDGESIAKPLTKFPIFPPMVVQMISVGEETGQVDIMLEKIAEFYDQEVEAAVDSLTSLIEPILIAIIGGCVGAAVVALYMPMFNIIKLI